MKKKNSKQRNNSSQNYKTKKNWKNIEKKNQIQNRYVQNIS